MLHRISLFLQQLSTCQLAWIAFLLCLPAFLINLGLIAFIGDEGIRALVALEMKLSGDYIVPTLNGEFYFNKPPLYNWIILGISSLFGYFGEWPSRLTTLFSLAFFAWVVYYFIKKYTDQLTGISVSLMLLTCGRILFWDSMLGLIDIFFSAIIFLNWMVIWHFGKKENWQKLFLFSYLLFSIGFLLKGLPALVFQGISIITALILFKNLKQRIFSKEHILGALIGIIPTLIYYFLYANSVSLQHVFSILTDQSLQRTATHHGFLKTIIHLFTFPLEQFYHFLPWALLAIPYFHPKFRTWLKEDDFIRFCFWMMLVNIPVYWISVQVYPRYLLMFVPLFTLVGYVMLKKSLAISLTWWKVVKTGFLILAALGTVMVLLMFVHPPVRKLPYVFPVWIISLALLLFTLVGLFRDSARMFIWMSIALLVVRITFDMVVLPLRAQEFKENACRKDIRRAADIHADKKWLIYGETETHQVARFYTSAYTNQIIRKTESANDTNALYIVDRLLYPAFPGVQVDSIMLERGQVLALMRIP